MKRHAFALVAFLAAAGCSGDKVTVTEPEDLSAAPTAAAVGSYTLVKVNGMNLPYTFFSDGFDWEVASGTLVLRADRSYTETQMWGDESNPEIMNGTFVVVGSRIVFTVPPLVGFPGTISNGVVTYTLNGLAFQYQRQ